MIFFKRFLFNRVFTCYLTIAFLTLSFTSSASGMFIPSTQREADLHKIQKVLELKLVQHKLSRLGFSKQEIEARVKQLDDDQLHEIATQVRALEAGGGLGFIETLTLMVVAAALVAALLITLVVMGGIYIWEHRSELFTKEKDHEKTEEVLGEEEIIDMPSTEEDPRVGF